MRIVFGVFKWSIFLGCLAVVGVSVFFFVRYRPRSTIEGPIDFMHLSADGSRLATQDKGSNGPLRVWDTHSGRVVHEWVFRGPIRGFSASPDDRHISVQESVDRVHLMDFQTGKAWQFDRELEGVDNLSFSP